MEFTFMARPCTSELLLKVNCRLEVNCRIKFGLACQLLAEPAQILSYNSLSAAIHLCMIQAYISSKYVVTHCKKHYSTLSLIFFLLNQSMSVWIIFVYSKENDGFHIKY